MILLIVEDEEGKANQSKEVRLYILSTDGKDVKMTKVSISQILHFWVGIALYTMFKKGINKNNPKYISIYHEYGAAEKSKTFKIILFIVKSCLRKTIE